MIFVQTSPADNSWLRQMYDYSRANRRDQHAIHSGPSVALWAFAIHFQGGRPRQSLAKLTQFTYKILFIRHITLYSLGFQFSVLRTVRIEPHE